MIFLFVFGLAAGEITGFLQQYNSSGQLGEGISTIASEISTFSSDLSQSFKDLDTSIDTSLSVSSQVAVSLIDGEKNEIEIDLDSIKSNIEDIQQILSYSNDYCEILETCKSCSSCNNCGWCNSRAICIPGTSDGPNFGECEDWLYDNCEFSDCNSYQTCTSCLATQQCSWCEFGHLCTSGQNSCSSAFFIANLDSCPNSDQGVNNHKKGENPYLKSELNSLQEDEAYLIGIINDLANDKEDILESAANGQNVVVSGMSVLGELNDLAETVDGLQDSELSERQDYRHSLADKEVNEIEKEISEETEENSKKQIKRIQSDYEDVISGVNEMESNVGGELDYIDQELFRLANALETATIKKKKQD